MAPKWQQRKEQEKAQLCRRLQTNTKPEISRPKFWLNSVQIKYVTSGSYLPLLPFCLYNMEVLGRVKQDSEHLLSHLSFSECGEQKDKSGVEECFVKCRAQISLKGHYDDMTTTGWLC